MSNIIDFNLYIYIICCLLIVSKVLSLGIRWIKDVEYGDAEYVI